MQFNGEKLKIIREKTGENRAQTAEALGLKTNTYTNYESGRRIPRADVLCLICEHFNVTADYFLDAVDHPYAINELAERRKGQIISMAKDVMEYVTSYHLRSISDDK